MITHQKFVEVRERIRAEEKRQQEAIATELRKKHEDQLREKDEALQKANTDRVALELKHKQDLEAVKKAVEDATAQKAAADLQRARDVLGAKHQEELLAVKADAAKKLDDALEKLSELEAKTERAEPTIDVLEELKAAFDEDRIVPLPADTGTATILIEVKGKAAICGKILIDARPRKSWQANFAAKLHDEMIEEKADHAILATTVFPKDEDQIYDHKGVLVVHPGRVVEIVRILRRLMAKMWHVKASTEQQADKKSKLYALISSPAGRQRLAESGVLAKQIEKLDADEAEEHRKVWKKRNDITKKLLKVSDDLIDDIDEILEGGAK